MRDLFDPHSKPSGWFDETLDQSGWFDQDFTSDGGVVATLFATENQDTASFEVVVAPSPVRIASGGVLGRRDHVVAVQMMARERPDTASFEAVVLSPEEVEEITIYNNDVMMMVAAMEDL